MNLENVRGGVKSTPLHTHTHQQLRMGVCAPHLHILHILLRSAAATFHPLMRLYKTGRRERKIRPFHINSKQSALISINDGHARAQNTSSKRPDEGEEDEEKGKTMTLRCWLARLAFFSARRRRRCRCCSLDALVPHFSATATVTSTVSGMQKK